MATVRRVGFFATPVPGVDYTTLQLAHDAAAAGDTIYMFPGAYMNCNVAKKLIIFGPGYFLNPADPTYPGNSGLQATTNTTTSNAFFSLNAGSNGTEVYGCNFDYYVGINGASGNILFKRCRFKSTGGGIILMYANCNQVTFQQCVIEDRIQVQNSNITITNLSFINCLFAFQFGVGFNLAASNTLASGLIQNCVFAGNVSTNALSDGSWLIQNSISQLFGFSGANILYVNNIGTGGQFPAGNGNQQNVAWNTIFNLTGSWDGKYALKTGSPAVGAGVGGIDCGIFGGPSPYRLSGIPAMPTIYSISSPQGTIPSGNTIQIDISTRSNN